MFLICPRIGWSLVPRDFVAKRKIILSKSIKFLKLIKINLVPRASIQRFDSLYGPVQAIKKLNDALGTRLHKDAFFSAYLRNFDNFHSPLVRRYTLLFTPSPVMRSYLRNGSLHLTYYPHSGMTIYSI